jgi:hypothetical protein
MRRREFIALLGGAAGISFNTAPLYAQEAGRIYRVGFVSAAPREEAWYTALFEELHGLGFVEGQNLTVIPGGFGVRKGSHGNPHPTGNDPGILATDIKSVSCGVSSMRVMRLENRIRN